MWTLQHLFVVLSIYSRTCGTACEICIVNPQPTVASTVALARPLEPMLRSLSVAAEMTLTKVGGCACYIGTHGERIGTSRPYEVAGIRLRVLKCFDKLRGSANPS